MKSPTILVPIDFSAHQELVLAQATSLALRMSAEIILLHCAEPLEFSVVAVEPIYIPPAILERFTRDHSVAVQEKLNTALKALDSSIPVKKSVRHTDASSGILAEAVDSACDFIVMGSHGAGLDRFLLGSVAERVTREATCPVVVARNEEKPSKFLNVIVGIDFSKDSKELVALALRLAPPEATIHLVHSWQPPHLSTAHLFGSSGHESLFGTLSEGLAQHVRGLEKFADSLVGDKRFSLHVETGRPSAILLSLYDSLGADAVFVGAHNSMELRNMLGSISDRVLRHCGTTVLLAERCSSTSV